MAKFQCKLFLRAVLLAEFCSYVLVTSAPIHLNHTVDIKTVKIVVSHSDDFVTLRTKSLQDALGHVTEVLVAKEPIGGRLCYRLQDRQCRADQVTNLSRSDIEAGNVLYHPVSEHNFVWDAFMLVPKYTNRQIWVVMISKSPPETILTSNLSENMHISADNKVFSNMDDLENTTRIIVVQQPRVGQFTLGSSFTMADVRAKQLKFDPVGKLPCGVASFLILPPNVARSELRKFFIAFRNTTIQNNLQGLTNLRRKVHCSKFTLCKQDLLVPDFPFCEETVQIKFSAVTSEVERRTSQTTLPLAELNAQGGCTRLSISQDVGKKLFFYTYILPDGETFGAVLLNVTFDHGPQEGQECIKYMVDADTHTPPIIMLPDIAEDVVGFSLSGVIDVKVTPTVEPSKLVVNLEAPPTSDLWICRRSGCKHRERRMSIKFTELSNVNIAVFLSATTRSNSIKFSITVTDSVTTYEGVQIGRKFELPVIIPILNVTSPRRYIKQGDVMEIHIRYVKLCILSSFCTVSESVRNSMHIKLNADKFKVQLQQLQYCTN